METLLQPPLLLDGAAATAYRKAGMPGRAVPAFWALEHPDMAGDLVRRYTAAGCDVLYAPTFGLSPLSRPERSADELRDANRRLLLMTRRSAEKEAAGRHVLIAGDLAGVGSLSTPKTGTATGFPLTGWWIPTLSRRPL